MFGSVKHGGDKSPLAGGPHYHISGGLEGCGGLESLKLEKKNRCN